MSYEFKGTENLRRMRSLCLSGNTMNDTRNTACVVWKKKQLRRKVIRINRVWYVILSQKNLCRLESRWWLLERLMEVHFSLWKTGWQPWCCKSAVYTSLEPFWLLWTLWDFAGVYHMKHLRPILPSKRLGCAFLPPPFFFLSFEKLFKTKCWPKF